MTSRDGLDAIIALQSGAGVAFVSNGLGLWCWMHYHLPLPETLPHALLPALGTSLPALLLYKVAPWLPFCSRNPRFARYGMAVGMAMWVYCVLRYLLGPEFLRTLLW
jgi:hypothetical protein